MSSSENQEGQSQMSSLPLSDNMPALPDLPTMQVHGSTESESDAEPFDVYTPRNTASFKQDVPLNVGNPPPSPGTRAAAELHEMYRNSPPGCGRLSAQAKKDIGHGINDGNLDNNQESKTTPTTKLPALPTPPVPPSHPPPSHTQAAPPPTYHPSSTADSDAMNSSKSNSLSSNASLARLNVGNDSTNSESTGLQTPVSQKGPAGSMEALGEIAQETETIGVYLRQAMQLKKIDILKEAKGKADILFAKPEFIATKAKVETMDPTIPIVAVTLTSLDQLMKSYLMLEPEIKRLSAETLDIIRYYLKQGVLDRNRDMIKEALLRLSLVDRGLIDKSLLGPAEELVKELDARHVTEQFLVSASTAKDLQALDDAITKAKLLNMREDESKELSEAIRVRAKIRDKQEKGEKENSRRVAGFVTKFFKNKADKSEKKSDSSRPKKVLFTTELQQVTDIYSRCVPAQPIELTTCSTNTTGDEEKNDTAVQSTKHSEKFVNVPMIVADCMDYILQHSGRNEPGIFRLAGNRDIMAHIVAEYEVHYNHVANSGTDLSTLMEIASPIPSPAAELANVNDAANILKQYLRSLPEPLIPFTAYPEWIALGQKLRQNESEENVQALQVLCSNLPVQCKDLLQYLSFHLFYITKNSDVNKMTEHNLAIVFAPNLLRPKVETQNTLISDSPVTILIIESVIKYYYKLF